MRNGYLIVVVLNGLIVIIVGMLEGVDFIMFRFYLEEKKGSIIFKIVFNLCEDNYWYYNLVYNIE